MIQGDHQMPGGISVEDRIVIQSLIAEMFLNHGGKPPAAGDCGTGTDDADDPVALQPGSCSTLVLLNEVR